MRVLFQKVSEGAVIYHKESRKIGKGLVLFVGFTEGDDLTKIQYMAKKVAHLRIFEDENQVMNLNVMDVSGECLSISQFTLYGDTTQGNRPSYVKAMKREGASDLYRLWNQELSKYVPVQEGFFGEDMSVHIVNEGPTTIWLEKE